MKAIFILCISYLSAFAADTSNLREIGRWPAFQAKSNKIRVIGNYAYVAADTDGFIILDVTDASTPVPIGSCNFIGAATDVAIIGNTAYVATYGNGIKRIDITTRTAPRLLSEIVPTEYVNAVAVYNNHLYAVHVSALRVYDISNPAAIRQVGNVALSGTKDLAVFNGYAFVLAQSSGLNIYDVRNPAAPVRVGGYNTPGTATSLYMPHSSSAYIADGAGGALLVSASNPAAPRLEETYATTGYCYAVTQKGGRMFAASNPGGFEVFNDFNGVREGGLRTQNATPTSIAYKDTYAYVSFGNAGLQVIDLEIDYLPRWSSGYGDGCHARDIDIVENRAFVSWVLGGVQVIDLSNQQNPRRLNTLLEGSAVYGAAVQFTRAYVAYSGYASIFRINNFLTTPTFTSIGGQYNANTFVNDVEITAAGPLIAAGTAGIAQLSEQVAYPSGAMLVGGRFDTPGHAYDIEYRDGLAFVADGPTGLQIIHVASTPYTRRGAIDTAGNATAVCLSESVAFVADGVAGLAIIDVSNPTAPRVRATLDTPRDAIGVCATGKRIYVADRTSIQVIDATNLDSPTLVGSLPLQDAQDVAAIGNFLYVANGSWGFRIYEILPEVRLEMRRVNDQYELRWPEAYPNFQLQYSDGLQPPLWEDHPIPPEIINGELSVPIYAFDGRRYFRLLSRD